MNTLEISLFVYCVEEDDDDKRIEMIISKISSSFLKCEFGLLIIT